MKNFFRSYQYRHFLLIIPVTLAIFLTSVFTPFAGNRITLASGIMYAKVGDTVEIEPTDYSSSYEYSWILKKGNEVMPISVSDGSTESQPASTSSKRVFENTFLEEGEYTVNLIRTDKRTNETLSTIVTVMVSLSSPTFETTKVGLETLPKATDGIVTVSGDSAEVIFLPKATGGGAPSEFRIDADIAVDSDDDGIADNDIDNKLHSSFYTGNAWSTVYSNDKPSRIAELTVLYDAGSTEKTTVEIVFSETLAEDLKNKPLKAVLETIPPSDGNGIIHLKKPEEKVMFFSGKSEGDILEYRIDKNIIFDTNEDGDPANDVDNLDSDSFTTGSSWETVFKDSWGEISIQLLVVGSDRKGSKIERTIVFDAEEIIPDENPDEIPEDLPPVSFMKLISSQEEVFRGESVDFLLLGMPEGVETQWDFDGDSVTDYEGEKTTLTYRYETAGTIPLTVIVKNNGEEITRFTKNIVVKGSSESESLTSPPVANFIFSAHDNAFTFENTSTADPRLLNGALSYSWDFGDNGTSDEMNPSHTYANLGMYSVVLTITDSIGRSTTTAQNIEVKSLPQVTPPVIPSSSGNGEEPVTPPKDPPASSGNGESPQVTAEEKTEGGGGWILIIVLIFLVPIILIGAYLIIRKIQLPDLSFEEIIIMDLEKLKGKKFKKEGPVLTPGSPDGTIVQGAGINPEVVSAPLKDQSAPSPSPVQPAPPQTPSWLKTDEDEITTDKETPSYTEESVHKAVENPPLAQADGEAPDWLKPHLNTGDSVSPAPVSLSSPKDDIEDATAPDWLNPQDEAIPSVPTPGNPEEMTVPAIPEEHNNESALPDWLKGEDENNEIVNGTTPPIPEATPVDEGEQNNGGSEPPAPPQPGQNISANPGDHHDEEALPDWLKGKDE